MSPLRNAFVIAMVALILFGFSEPTTALQDEQKSNTVMIEFPIGDIEIRHLESRRGMILNVKKLGKTLFPKPFWGSRGSALPSPD